jgi:putative FmdB family regulatory protein
MPTYEFRCAIDKSFVEIQQGFYDNIVPNCPLCGKEMNKIIHATPAIFNGTGWGKSK